MAIPLTATWRTFPSSCLALVWIPIVFQLVIFTTSSNAQNFDPVVEDKLYLNKIEKEIENEVNKTRVNFFKQAHLLDDVARQFVAAQLKENLFLALRVLAEKELAHLRGNSSADDEEVTSFTFTSEISSTGVEFDETTTLRSTQESTTSFVPSTTTLQSLVRRKRQEDGDDDGDVDGGDAAAAAAGGVPNRPTIPPQIGLLPQVANLVRVIFGGNGQVNFTSYVASASKLLPRPVGNQVLGLVKILTNANNNNRNSFTTANPLIAGQLPANLDLKSPAFAGLTQEQLLALGLPPTGAGLEGLTPEQLNSLVIAAGAGAGGVGGTPVPGSVGATGLPGGLTPQDIAYLQALGIPGLPNLDATKPPPPQRSTRKPRPANSPYNKNKQPQQQQPNSQNQQQLQNQQHLQNQQQLQGQQQLQNQQQLHSQQQLQGQHHFPNQQQHLQNQQQLQAPPSAHEQAFLSPPPNYVNGPSNYGQNPQFASADKDFLPLNLNPNKQTLSEIKQHLHASQQVPVFQETPQSAAQPTLFAPDTNNFLSHSSNFPPVNNKNNFPPANNNNFSPSGGSTLQHSGPASLNSNHLNKQQSNIYNSQSSNAGSSFGQQSQNNNFVPKGTSENGLLSPGGTGTQSNQGLRPAKVPGKNRRPRPPSAFQQQQANLQAQQLQQLQLLNLQDTNQNPEPQPQISEPELQSIQTVRPQTPQIQQNFQQQQQSPQSQFIQQQPQFNQQSQNPAFQQRPQQQFLQQQNLQQKYQQQVFRPQRPPPIPQDEDESEEADTDYDNVSRQGRQLNLLQNLLPTFLRPTNTNTNNNVNNPPANNNNSNNQNNQNNQNNNNNNNNGSQGNNNTSNNNNGSNNNTNGNQANNGFDLNMFAMNLGRGMQDVIRVMPDLFRGAREGLQLIQALSTILRAFPGLADALPIAV